MKILKLIVIGITLFLSSAAQAQISINVNIGSPPQWGPAGYTDVRYYYIPDIEAYYDIHSSMFIYYVGNEWIHRTHLPDRYRSFDLYSGYKIVMTDYRGNSPYIHFNEHKIKYKKGYRRGEQKTIGQKSERGNSKGGSISGNNNVRTGNDKSKPSHNSKESKGHQGGKGKSK